MDLSTLFGQILDALSKATDLAISNNKAIAAQGEQITALTSQLNESMADDAEDAAKIAAFEEEKARQEASLADMASKLDALKAELSSVSPIPSPSPTPSPIPTTEAPPVIDTVPPPVTTDEPVISTEPGVLPVVNAPPTGTIGVTESVIMPGSTPVITAPPAI